jgi:hypothetical protein
VTLVAVCSLKGSPGVSTAALGLAACWRSGEQPVLVECDPAGGDLLARFRLETFPGLVSLAAAARRGAEPGLVWQHSQRLPGGLPVVVGPAGAGQARAALAQLATAGDGGVLRRAADRAGTVVIADCGRVSGEGPVRDLLRAADLTLVLTRVHDDALAHLAAGLSTGPGWLRGSGIVLVGDGFATQEVVDVLGIEVMGRLPEDARGAALLAGSAARKGAPARFPLMRALGPLAVAVAEAARQRRSLRPGPGSPSGAVLDPRQLWNGARR